MLLQGYRLSGARLLDKVITMELAIASALLLSAILWSVQGLKETIRESNLKTEETEVNCSNILLTRSNDLLSTLRNVDTVKTLLLKNETQQLLFEFRKGLGTQWMQARGECGHKEPIPLLKVGLDQKLELKVHVYAEMAEQDDFRGRLRYLSGVVSPQCAIVRVNNQVASLFFLRGVMLAESHLNNAWETAFHHDWMYGIGSGMRSIVIDTDSDSFVNIFAELSCPNEKTHSRYAIPIGMAQVGDIRQVLSNTSENGGLGAIYGRRFMTASLDPNSM